MDSEIDSRRTISLKRRPLGKIEQTGVRRPSEEPRGTATILATMIPPGLIAPLVDEAARMRSSLREKILSHENTRHSQDSNRQEMSHKTAHG